MQWFYLDAQGQQVPVQEAKLAQLAQVGAIRPDTQMWKEGLANWLPATQAKPDLFAGQAAQATAPVLGAQKPVVTQQQTTAQPGQTNPYAVGQAAGGAVATEGGGSAETVKRCASIIVQNKGWIMTVAIFQFLAFFYIIPIFLGLKLLKAIKSAEMAVATGDERHFHETQTAIAAFFKIQVIVLIISLVVAIILPFIMGGIIGFMGVAAEGAY